MIDARVTGYRGDRLVAAARRRPACSRCLDGRGCGMGLLGRSTPDHVTLSVAAPDPRPPVGSVVTLAASPGIAVAAIAGYGLPLAGILAGAAVGPGASLVGFACGVALARWCLRGRVAWRVAPDGR